MELTIDTHQLRLIIEESAELGALMALSRTGRIKPFLKKSEAFRKYGRANVEQWLARGMITFRKDGDGSDAWRIDRLEIEAIVRSISILRELYL